MPVSTIFSLVSRLAWFTMIVTSQGFSAICFCISIKRNGFSISIFLFFPSKRKSSSCSMPINFRPSKFAAIPVVELPANGSSMISPTFVEASIILYSNRKGFWVGCFPHVFSHNPTVGNFQTSGISLPPFSCFINS